MRNFLAYAAAKYEAGEPIITDAEFDRLEGIYGYDRVGAAVDVSRAIPHAYRLYSLQKCFVGGKQIELPSDDIVETPKLDGAAVSLFYIEGRLSLALTRGDGVAGLDITEKLRTLVPNKLDTLIPVMQVNGEVVAPKTIPNSRNYAAGALNLKSLEEFKTRELAFVSYGILPAYFATYRDDLKLLAGLNFKTIGDCDWDEFPQDGLVFRVNNNALFEELGFTGKHPRGAYALKEIQEGVVTTLEHVEWRVGRSGVVAPRAIIKPVKIGDATVTYATLHNIAHIRKLNLEIGCSIEIIRSGEIIPKVIRRVYGD